MKMNRVVVLLFWFFCLLSICWMTSSSVVLIGSNVTLSFDDIEANFAPAIKGSGKCGVLYLANPLDACSDLSNKVEKVFNITSPFALVIRGGCSFEEKVRRVQTAGFKAAIVYDNDDDGILVAMAGNAAGIKIHAVFVSKASGEILKKYAGSTDMELWLIPSFENSAWSIMAISFISLLAMSAVLATCFFVRRHQIRREHPQSSRVREFHGMSRRLVKAMPSLIFTAVLEDNCTSRTCAICLEDYTLGEKLRILPCRHSNSKIFTTRLRKSSADTFMVHACSDAMKTTYLEKCLTTTIIGLRPFTYGKPMMKSMETDSHCLFRIGSD